MCTLHDIHRCLVNIVDIRGGSRIFQRGGQGNGYMYKLYYIHIAIIHIIILNEVHCNLLKAIDA